MRYVLAGLVVSVCLWGQGSSGDRAKMHDATATTYEHLANAIIEIRKTENSIVAGILMHHESSAREHLVAAKDASGSVRTSHLEAAATEITYIANEGDKQVQAIRQRLLKAGHHHHHHADSETKGDYIFIDSSEKKSLLDLANRVGRLGQAASVEAIDSAMNELSSVVGKALASG